MASNFELISQIYVLMNKYQQVREDDIVVSIDLAFQIRDLADKVDYHRGVSDNLYYSVYMPD